MPITDETIPEGKVISTIYGGQKALELSMEKLKKFGFTGYLLVKKRHEGYVSEGYIIVKDGNTQAAVYGRRADVRLIVTKRGEEALKLAWGDSYDDDSELEVHGRLDINTVLRQFPGSEITVASEKKTPRRRTRFSLEWGNNGAAGEPEKIDGIPEELASKLEAWRSAGYVTKHLQEELGRNPDGASTLFEQFEGNVKRVEFLRQELDSLDCSKFATDAERLKAMMKNPYKITAVEATLQALKIKMEQEKMREREEKLAEIMMQMGEAPPEPETHDIPELETQHQEERLAGQGEIIPSFETRDWSKCTVCGADLYGKDECPTCGANNSLPRGEPHSTGDSNLIREYTFDNFVVGESNRFSHSAATAVSKPGTSTYNPLFICSGTGLGKTHLLNAIGNIVADNFPDKKVLYISMDAFINEFIDATKNNRKKQFRKKYRDLDFLLLDDIQFISGQEAVQDEFFHTFNALYKEGKQIVMTSDRPIREVSGIKERLISRFDAGLITDMHPPELETRQAILSMKADDLKIVVGDDVLKFIALRYTENIRMLEGALKTMMAYSDLMKVPMTMETAKQALKDDMPESTEDIGPDAEPGVFDDSQDRLKLSHSYLIEEDRPVKCFEYLVENLNMGMKGLAFTRVNPKRLREQYDLENATLLWLTDKEGDSENRVMPVLERIIYKIEDFLNYSGKVILLIDGLDYLVSNNNFDSVLRFLRRLIDEISESDAIFIMSLTPDTIDEQGLNILEREMEIISFNSPKTRDTV